MKKLKEYLIITFGIVLVSIGVKFFLAPNNIAAGGVTGIAIIINHLIPKLSIPLLIFILNIILFFVGFIIIGNKFGIKTLYASLALSFTIWIMDKLFLKNIYITKDLFLASIFGTLIIGIGLGIIFNENASTGGTDIIAKILNKFMHIDIGKSLLLVDFIITIFASVAFGLEIGMYSLLSVIFNGFVIDYVIEGLNMSKQIFVISFNNSLVSRYIIEKLQRGCTIFHGQGAYRSQDINILYTVLNRKEFIRLRNYIKKIDPKAFITVSNVHEVLGEGFKNI